MSDRYDKLQATIKKRRDAENAITTLLQAEYPIGSEIAWDWRGRKVGTVVMHSLADRIKVARPGQPEYWINAYRILP